MMNSLRMRERQVGLFPISLGKLEVSSREILLLLIPKKMTFPGGRLVTVTD